MKVTNGIDSQVMRVLQHTGTIEAIDGYTYGELYTRFGLQIYANSRPVFKKQIDDYLKANKHGSYFFATREDQTRLYLLNDSKDLMLSSIVVKLRNYESHLFTMTPKQMIKIITTSGSFKACGLPTITEQSHKLLVADSKTHWTLTIRVKYRSDLKTWIYQLNKATLQRI